MHSSSRLLGCKPSSIHHSSECLDWCARSHSSAHVACSAAPRCSTLSSSMNLGGYEYRGNMSTASDPKSVMWQQTLVHWLLFMLRGGERSQLPGMQRYRHNVLHGRSTMSLSVGLMALALHKRLPNLTTASNLGEQNSWQHSSTLTPHHHHQKQRPTAQHVIV